MAIRPSRSLVRALRVSLFPHLRPWTALSPSRRSFTTYLPSRNDGSFYRAHYIISPLAFAISEEHARQASYSPQNKLIAGNPVREQAFLDIVAELDLASNRPCLFDKKEHYDVMYEEVRMAGGDAAKERQAVERGMAKYVERLERAVEERVEAYRRLARFTGDMGMLFEKFRRAGGDWGREVEILGEWGEDIARKVV